MDSTGSSPRKKQKVVSKTSEYCEKDDEVQRSSSIPKISLHDSGHTLSLGERQKLLHKNAHIDSSKEVPIDKSDQQGEQNLQNVSPTSAPEDKTGKTLLDSMYQNVRPSTSTSLNESHETGKTIETCGPPESEQTVTTISSDSNDSESDDYLSGEVDEIKIESVTQIDDREPCQDHAAERVLYCEPCANLKPSREFNMTPEAKCICFTCEVYLCLGCGLKHSNHLTLCVDEHKQEKGLRITEMLNRLELEEEIQRQMAEYRYNVCGRIDVRMPRESTTSELCIVIGVCISKDRNLLILTDCGHSKSVKVFNMYNHKMVQCIRFSSSPHGVAEIPRQLIQKHFADYIDTLEKDSSHTYIAVTFPMNNQILILDFTKNHARIVHTILIREASECKEVFLCDGLLITYCMGYDDTDHQIKFLTLAGMEVSAIDILNLPGPGFTRTDSAFHIAVHEDTKTIYISSSHDGCIVGVRIGIGILARNTVIEAVSTKDMDIDPGIIHVDSDGNLFVSTWSLAGYPSEICKITDNLKRFELIVPSTWLNHQMSCVYTSRKGRLYCGNDAYTSTKFVTVLQREQSFLSYSHKGNL